MKEKDNIYQEVDFDIEFVCDECCLPLSLYGKNIILTFEGDRFITRMLCDLHTFDLLGEEYEY